MPVFFKDKALNETTSHPQKCISCKIKMTASHTLDLISKQFYMARNTFVNVADLLMHDIFDKNIAH